VSGAHPGLDGAKRVLDRLAPLSVGGLAYRHIGYFIPHGGDAIILTSVPYIFEIIEDDRAATSEGGWLASGAYCVRSGR
jgi:hypothetical protein